MTLIIEETNEAELKWKVSRLFDKKNGGVGCLAKFHDYKNALKYCKRCIEDYLIIGDKFD